MGDAKDFGDFLAEFEREQAGQVRERDPRAGEKVTGRVLSIGLDSAFVDLGAKSEGIVDLVELYDERGRLTVSEGDTLKALVTGRDPESGCIRLRVKPGRGEADPSEIRQAWEEKLPVEGMVQGVVKGGVEVKVGGFRAFCPISQLADRYVEDAEEFVGRRLQFRVSRFSEGRRGPDVVLSRRALLQEEAAARAAETRKLLEPGATLRGTVSSLASYGAFIDLGGLEGLLHVSEIGHTRLEHPEEVLAVGQEVEVKVLKVESGKDGKGERISLSRKALAPDPWEGAAMRFPEDASTRGKVVRLTTFGAFVELAPGVEGLLHISELSGSELAEGREVRQPGEVLQPGQPLAVRVLRVDEEQRRISLAPAAPERHLPEISAQRKKKGGVPGGGFGAMGAFFKKAGLSDSSE